jgi:AraC-like DNA-binding protein
MKYREIKPNENLAPYVKFYFIYESASGNTFEDTVYPSGNVEIIFNLGIGKWQILSGNKFVTTPRIEFWGQIIKPLPIRSLGNHSMLGIRFHPHAAACFLEGNIDVYNNEVVDFGDLSGVPVQTLYAKMMAVEAWDERILLVEEFLSRKILYAKKNRRKIDVVGHVINEITRDDFFDKIETIASRYGVTSRYLQKIFVEHTGLTLKLYTKINRFQNSLKLISQNDTSLTSIAYSCGYFDQSHFIRDFKSFTGMTPSGYTLNNSPLTSAFTNS